MDKDKIKKRILPFEDFRGVIDRRSKKSPKPMTERGDRAEEIRRRQEDDMFRKSASAIAKNLTAYLKRHDIPSAEEFCRAEDEAKRANELLETISRVKSLYFGESGIKNVLLAIYELAEYVPAGLRGEPEGGMSLPLYAAVRNTYLSTLERRLPDIGDCKIRLWELSKEPAAEIDPQRIKDITQTFRDELRKPIVDNPAVRELVGDYLQRYRAAVGLSERLSSAVSERIVKAAEEFCDSYDKLLNGEPCRAMTSYEILSDISDMSEPEAQGMSPSAYAYWKKLNVFGEDIRDFIKKWDEDKFR